MSYYKQVIEVEGVRKTVAEWSEESGVKPKTILSRMTNGWSAKDSVFTEVAATRSTGAVRKEEVMWNLNDLPRSELPAYIREVIGERCNKTGTQLRRVRPDLFDRYYNEVVSKL